MKKLPKVNRNCLFCRSPELNYKPTFGCVEYVCSRCVLLLSTANSDDLNCAYKKAMICGSHDKAKVIEMFLTEGVPDETENFKRGVVRKRPLSTTRPARDRQR